MFGLSRCTLGPKELGRALTGHRYTQWLMEDTHAAERRQTRGTGECVGGVTVSVKDLPDVGGAYQAPTSPHHTTSTHPLNVQEGGSHWLLQSVVFGWPMGKARRGRGPYRGQEGGGN